MSGIRKTGAERFLVDGELSGFDLLGFWQWSGSDLVGNTARGLLAEYIVALDLGVADGVRVEWDPFDLVTKDGVKVEVKSAAYVQTWEQVRHSVIGFSIAPASAWEGANYVDERKRRADVYVFALLHCRERELINPLDMDQWEFYVIATRVLDEFVPVQKSIRLSSLMRLSHVKTVFGGIGEAIRDVLRG